MKEIGRREVAIIGGGGADLESDSYRLLREVAQEHYDEDNVRLIEVDWQLDRGRTYPEWYRQAEASILDQCRPNPDLITFSAGGLLGLDFSTKHPVGMLTSLSMSCWHGPQVFERAHEFGSVLTREQLEAVSKLDVPFLARVSTASQAHIFYGDQELPILQETSVVVAENLRQTRASTAPYEHVTLTAIPDAIHSDALGSQYLHVVRAVLAAVAN